MRTRTRNAIGLVVVSAALGVGLAEAARHRNPIDLRPHAIEAIPAGANVIATADLRALRASPVGAPFLREGREIPGLGKVKDICGFDPIDTLDEAALGVPAADDDGEFGLAASGKVDVEAVIRCATKVIEARGGHAAVTKIGSFSTIRDTASAIGGGEIAVREGLLLFGGGLYLRAMIEAADNKAATIRGASAAHNALAAEVGDATVRITVVLTAEQHQTLVEEVGADAQSSPVVSVVGGALAIDLGDLVGVRAAVRCAESAACARLATQLDEARLARADDYALKLSGFGELLKHVRIDDKGEVVHASVSVPADHATVLLDRLLKLRSFRHPMPDDREPQRPAGDAGAVQPDEVIKPDGGTSHSPR